MVDVYIFDWLTWVRIDNLGLMFIYWLVDFRVRNDNLGLMFVYWLVD